MKSTKLGEQLENQSDKNSEESTAENNPDVTETQPASPAAKPAPAEPETKNSEQPSTPPKPPEPETKGSEPPSTPPPPPKPPEPAKPVAKPGKGLSIFALLVAIVAIAIAGYLWQTGMQQQQLAQKNQGDISGAIQRVDQQSNQARELQRQLDRLSDGASQQQRQLEQQINNLQQQLASQHKRLLSLSTTDRNDWLLAEAEYLMRLANQRLLMGKEIKGAQQLLKAADGIMLELDDSGLFPVRQALADDMAALRAAASVDLEGIYLKLSAAANQADQLRLIELPELAISPSSQQEATQPEAWQQRLETGVRAAWAKLSSYIQINRRDDIYKPLLAPEYEAAVRQNLRLMIEQAQMASLSGRQRLYEDSLGKARQWLINYYTLDKTASQALITTIGELSQQQIEITLPDISGSLRALKQYLESIHITPSPVAQKDSQPQGEQDGDAGESAQ